MKRVALQGMEGSHAEAAAVELAARRGDGPYELVRCPSVNLALEHAATGTADFALVAEYNSVRMTLPRWPSLVRVDAITVPVSYSLFARSGTGTASPDEVLMKDSSRVQCGLALARLASKALWKSVPNGTSALRALADGPAGPRVTFVLAPSHMEGRIPGTEVVASGIQDRADNAKTFALYARA